jgi:hypothetical protein
MCNARNHYDGCDCGFGPPYPWKITSGPRTDWYEASLTNFEEYKGNLKALKISRSLINEKIRKYFSLGFPIPKDTWAALSNLDKANFKSRFSHLLQSFRLEEKEFLDDEITIPIFRLHSPEIKDSIVMYEQIKSEEEPYAWSISILGFGTGDSQVFLLENKDSFSSCEGTCKLVRLPLKIRATSLDVFHGDQFLANTLRIEPAPKLGKEIINAGAKHQPGACKHKKNFKVLGSEFFPCAKDKLGEIRGGERTIGSLSEHKFFTKVSAFSLEGGFKTVVKRKVAITLKFNLPTGYCDYCLLYLEDPDGILWEIQ